MFTRIYDRVKLKHEGPSTKVTYVHSNIMYYKQVSQFSIVLPLIVSCLLANYSNYSVLHKLMNDAILFSLDAGQLLSVLYNYIKF